MGRIKIIKKTQHELPTSSELAQRGVKWGNL
jgi:hypothetical protein